MKDSPEISPVQNNVIFDQLKEDPDGGKDPDAIDSSPLFFLKRKKKKR